MFTNNLLYSLMAVSAPYNGIYASSSLGMIFRYARRKRFGFFSSATVSPDEGGKPPATSSGFSGFLVEEETKKKKTTKAHAEKKKKVKYPNLALALLCKKELDCRVDRGKEVRETDLPYELTALHQVPHRFLHVTKHHLRERSQWNRERRRGNVKKRMTYFDIIAAVGIDGVLELPRGSGVDVRDGARVDDDRAQRRAPLHQRLQRFTEEIHVVERQSSFLSRLSTVK